jgi:hypothetical protein
MGNTGAAVRGRNQVDTARKNRERRDKRPRKRPMIVWNMLGRYVLRLEELADNREKLGVLKISYIGLEANKRA